MKSFLLFKKFIFKTKEYIFIVLTTLIILLNLISKSYSEENVFTVDNVKIQGPVDLNFSRDKYIDKAFSDSFQILVSKILLSKDLTKMREVRIEKIRKLINHFQIVSETYNKNIYEANFKIFYNDKNVKKFLASKNISFSYPKNISAVFFPVMFVNNEIKSFDENYFYNEWNEVKTQNELINFLLPIEDLDDFSNLKKIKNQIEELNVSAFINKYNTENYAFILMDYNSKKLRVHIKTNFNSNYVNKNLNYDLNNIEDQTELNYILRDLKSKITDIWKESNIVDLFMPLSIKLKFSYNNLQELYLLRETFNKISIINNYTVEEININHSYFEIYYFGNPKKLKTALFEFGYKLQDEQSHWELYKDG